VLWSRKTQTLEICGYSQSEIKTEIRSNAANQTGLLITYTNEGMRIQGQERGEKTGKKET